MVWIPAELKDAATKIAASEAVTVSVRDFLWWFTYQRRTYWNVRVMRNSLDASGLTTEPNFEYVSLDSFVKLVAVQQPPTPGPATTSEPPSQPADGNNPIVGTEPAEPSTQSGPPSLAPTADAPVAISGKYDSDPTYRIGRLSSAGRTPMSVSPDAPLAEIITTMLIHDYSQLPVMTSRREVKGIVSWRSIGTRLALGTPVATARECMESANEIRFDAPLFKAVALITDHEYVLVRNEINEISGIVTTTDLSLTFNQLGEQFLLLGEIENHIRALIDGKFTVPELRDAALVHEGEQDVNDVSDLTFGDYIHLLENEARWNQLQLKVDRVLFVRELDKVRLIRNDVMHFDPDGVSPDEVETLRKFVRFLQGLKELT